MTIHALVVDDDPISRGMVSEQLLALQADSVKSVDSGRSALGMLQLHDEINLVVTDLRMPDLDGIALLAALDQFRDRVHVIIMSALGDKILRAASRIGIGHNLSILGVSSKPLGLRKLASMLERVRNRPEQAKTKVEELKAVSIDSIRAALTEEGHYILVQPELRSQDLSLEAVEVLSRWKHPALAQRSPADIITAAERAGIISELNQHLLDEVGAAWNAWARHKLSPRISINISAITMADRSFPDWINRSIQPYALTPQDLILEITETAIPASGTSNLEVACRLGMLGFELSVDDFGTGFANLQQLQDMPFCWLKIDQSFVRQMERSEEARTIVKSSIRMAHDLGLTTVGEGVETELHQRMLTDMGCDVLQGYLFARPMLPSELPAWHKEFQEKQRNAA